MQAAGNLVVAMIAFSEDSESPWPFITLSSFQERAATTKDLSGILYLGMNPVVSREQRLAWENYTNNHPDSNWYEEGREYQKTIGTDDLDNRPQIKMDDPKLDLSNGVANYIYDFKRDTTGKGVISPEADWYLPIWQVKHTQFIWFSIARCSFLTSSPLYRQVRSRKGPWSIKTARVTPRALSIVLSTMKWSSKAVSVE